MASWIGTFFLFFSQLGGGKRSSWTKHRGLAGRLFQIHSCHSRALQALQATEVNFSFTHHCNILWKPEKPEMPWLYHLIGAMLLLHWYSTQGGIFLVHATPQRLEHACTRRVSCYLLGYRTCKESSHQVAGHDYYITAKWWLNLRAKLQSERLKTFKTWNELLILHIASRFKQGTKAGHWTVWSAATREGSTQAPQKCQHWEVQLSRLVLFSQSLDHVIFPKHTDFNAFLLT